jgi:hypothetical protein
MLVTGDDTPVFNVVMVRPRTERPSGVGRSWREARCGRLVWGRLVMAVALLSKPRSVTAERYGRVIKRSAASRAGDPPGRRFHARFGPVHDLTLFDVWDNAEEYQAFGLVLMPILAKEEIGVAPAEPLENHRRIVGGDASALGTTIDELGEQAFFLRPVETLGETIDKATTKSSEGDTPNGSATT